MFKRLAAMLLIVPALVAASANPPAKPAAQWPEFRFGPARVGFNPDETTLSPGNVGTVVQGWSTTLKGEAADPLTSPIITGSTIYVVGSKLTALNTANGHVRWQVRPAGFPSADVVTEATPAIDGNGIFVAWAVTGTSSVVQDRNTATGALVSTTIPSVDFTSGPDTPAVRNGLVYFTVDTAPNQWMLYALAESTGAISWSDTFSGSYPFTPPAVTATALVVGLNTGKVDAFNPTTGSPLWSAATPASSDGVEGIAIEGSTTYAVVKLSFPGAVDGDGCTHLLDRAAGMSRRWIPRTRRRIRGGLHRQPGRPHHAVRRQRCHRRHHLDSHRPGLRGSVSREQRRVSRTVDAGIRRVDGSEPVSIPLAEKASATSTSQAVGSTSSRSTGGARS